MDEQHFKNILERYLNGKATPEETAAVDAFFEQYRRDGKAWPQDIMDDPDISAKKIFDGVFRKYEADTRRRKFLFSTVWKVAASLLILVGVGYGAYVLTPGREVTQPVSEVLHPGGDNAVLELADGTQIQLDSTEARAIPTQGAVAVVNENGRLAYAATGQPEDVVYNSIRTPRGGQYEIALADGSKVWLNAVSSLRFPTAFSGAERVVELKGEAYFEIAKNADMPFRVRVLPADDAHSHTDILVLGTHFNVMAYPEEAAIATTLVEGAVKIMQGNVSGVLKPGEQGRMTQNGSLEIHPDFDVSQAIAWKEGRFAFNDTPLEDIMRQVSRWYDVEVTFQDDVRSLQFGGVVSRREQAGAVLALLELTGEVTFEVTERNIIVKAAK